MSASSPLLSSPPYDPLAFKHTLLANNDSKHASVLPPPPSVMTSAAIDPYLPLLPFTLVLQVLDDVEPARRPARDHEDGDDSDARTAYLQPSLKAEPFARPELERDHQANIDFERFRGRV